VRATEYPVVSDLQVGGINNECLNKAAVFSSMGAFERFLSEWVKFLSY
jgi:hypothetical protein